MTSAGLEARLEPRTQNLPLRPGGSSVEQLSAAIARAVLRILGPLGHARLHEHDVAILDIANVDLLISVRVRRDHLRGREVERDQLADEATLADMALPDVTSTVPGR